MITSYQIIVQMMSILRRKLTSFGWGGQIWTFHRSESGKNRLSQVGLKVFFSKCTPLQWTGIIYFLVGSYVFTPESHRLFFRCQMCRRFRKRPIGEKGIYLWFRMPGFCGNFPEICSRKRIKNLYKSLVKTPSLDFWKLMSEPNTVLPLQITTSIHKYGYVYSPK